MKNMTTQRNKTREDNYFKEYFVREEGETTEEAIDAHLDEGYDDYEQAAKEADNNVSPGAAWDVVDRVGVVYRSGRAPA